MITYEILGAATMIREQLKYINCYNQECNGCPFFLRTEEEAKECLTIILTKKIMEIGYDEFRRLANEPNNFTE